METFSGYSLANLTQSQIDIINNTQQILQQDSDDNIVLVAYKKDNFK
jgi:hypothetical protein